MSNRLTRTETPFEQQTMERLQKSHVAVFGLGSVGSWCAEALVRGGVGTLTLVDDDFVSVNNLNRQVQAVGSSIGQPKAISMMLRLREIAPEGVYTPKCFRYCAESREDFFNQETRYDYVVDAIDLISCKLDLIETCIKANIPIVSALETGNKLDASSFCITDITKATGSSLAQVVRKQLHSQGITHHKVVYSPETAAETDQTQAPPSPGQRTIPASASWVPPVAGFLLAQAVILDLAEKGL